MDQWLYLALDLGSISVPLLFSIFERRFHFIQYAREVFISILIVAIPFLIWDAFFTHNGVWGFNESYHLPLEILGMPLEEWMFFFCIPFACIFTHEVLRYFFPWWRVSDRFARYAGILLSIGATLLAIFYWDRWYTVVNFSSFALLMVYTVRYRLQSLAVYLPSFLVVLIPFFIVNGVLTGSWISDQVVWYNDAENLGVRMGTIPFEDTFYAFTMLFGAQLIFDHLVRDRRGESSLAEL